MEKSSFKGKLIGGFVALVALLVVAVFQYQTTLELREAVQRDALRLEGMAAALTSSRAEALRPADLNALRDELTQRMVSAHGRIEALEAELESLHRRMADPAFFQGTHEETRPVVERSQALPQEIEDAYGRWAELDARS